MKATIMVTDVILRFRLAVIEHLFRRPQTWDLQVMTIQEVANVLVSLGFLDPEAAARLCEASTTSRHSKASRPCGLRTSFPW